MDNQLIVKDLLISFAEWQGIDNNGPTLVFLHGWRSEKQAWNGIVSRIKDKGLKIIAIDLPGFGKTQASKETMSVGDYAEIVAEFIKKLELKNVILIGHSFGGRIGIKLSSVHPELVSKLVLVDSAGFVMGQNKKSLVSAMAKIAKPFFAPKFMQPLRKRIYKTIGAEDYVAVPELQKTFVKVVGEDLTDGMRKIICPTQIIWGEEDAETPVEFGQRMRSFIPNSKFIILPGAGHFSFIDQPEEFAKILEKFIR